MQVHSELVLIASKVSLTGDQIIAGLKTFGGFTTLGELGTGIKTKRLIGTTAANQGGSVAIAHGLIGDKIIGIQILVRHITNCAIAKLVVGATGYDYDYYDTTNIYVINAPSNSFNIPNKPISVLITYMA